MILRINMIKININMELKNHRGDEIFKDALLYAAGMKSVSTDKNTGLLIPVEKPDIRYRKEVKVGDEWIDVEEIRNADRLINKVKRQLGKEEFLSIVEDNKY